MTKLDASLFTRLSSSFVQHSLFARRAVGRREDRRRWVVISPVVAIDLPRAAELI